MHVRSQQQPVCSTNDTNSPVDGCPAPALPAPGEHLPVVVAHSAGATPVPHVTCSTDTGRSITVSARMMVRNSSGSKHRGSATQPMGSGQSPCVQERQVGVHNARASHIAVQLWVKRIINFVQHVSLSMVALQTQIQQQAVPQVSGLLPPRDTAASFHEQIEQLFVPVRVCVGAETSTGTIATIAPVDPCRLLHADKRGSPRQRGRSTTRSP
jgi:hypothetical protein